MLVVWAAKTGASHSGRIRHPYFSAGLVSRSWAAQIAIALEHHSGAKLASGRLRHPEIRRIECQAQGPAWALEPFLFPQKPGQ